MNINTLTNKDASWPNALNNINPSVFSLQIKGDIGTAPRLGVIGTRRPTEYGRMVVDSLVTPLAQAGVCIVSGMAIGIDALAHESALNAGGKTIAVLPSSIERPYPARNRGLAERISNSGALISEYAAVGEVHKSNFIARNRIIAAMSDLLLVIEASQKSGTMHTVNFSIQLGKDVAAVPGQINHLYSAGTNKLIQDGAHVITSADDVLSLLGLDAKKENILIEDHDQSRIYACLEPQPRLIGEISTILQMDENRVRVALTGLEIQNIVARLENGVYARR